MGELGAMFNPGMRHELEERQAKAARREEEGNAKDGDLRIDLESGVAVINSPGGAGTRDADAGGRTTDDPGTIHADSNGADPDRAAQSDAGDAPAARSASAAGAAAVRAASRQVTQPKAAKASGAPQAPAVRPRGKRGAAATR